jgi:MarR family transcriptional regulator for hemolysin
MKEPIGRKMDKIGRMYQLELQKGLTHLDIDRSFYPLLLIEAGNGITQQELADKLLCDKVQVVRIIDYLSSNGYVERVQNQTDKRKYELTVTEKARRFIPEIKNVIENTNKAACKGLSESQSDELYNMLGIIENNLLSK